MPKINPKTKQTALAVSVLAAVALPVCGYMIFGVGDIDYADFHQHPCRGYSLRNP